MTLKNKNYGGKNSEEEQWFCCVLPWEITRLSKDWLQIQQQWREFAQIMVLHALYRTCNFVDICQKTSASPCIAQPSRQTFYDIKRIAIFTKTDFGLRINVSSQFLQT